MTMFQNLHRSLAPSRTLKIRCGACERHTAWTRDQAVQRLGPDATPFEIRRRLACAGCGARGCAHVWI